MARYCCANNTTPTANTYLRLDTNASVRMALQGFIFSHMTNTDQAVRLGWQRTTGGTSSATQTPEKHDIDSPAATVVANTDLSANPTLSGQPLLSWGMGNPSGSSNGNRNYMHWWAHPCFPIVVAVSSFLSLKDNAGTARDGDKTAFWSEPSGTPIRAQRGRRGIRRGYWHFQSQHHRGGVVGTRGYWNEYTMIQRETWPESFVPPNNLALFAEGPPAAANPIFEFRVPAYA